MAVFIARLHDIKDIDGELVICNVGPDIKNVMQLVGVDKLVKIFPTDAQAVEGLRNQN